jgi:hypothetical protein
MKSTRRRFLSLVLSSSYASALCAACTAPPAGTAATPLLTELHSGDAVRQVVVTQYTGSSQLGEPASCSVDTWLFDVTAPATTTPIATVGDCALYPAGASLPFAQQNWVCAGALIVAHGGQNEAVTMCPAAGEAPIDHQLACDGIQGGASVYNSSGPNEIDGDTVADLDVAATLPGAITITQPTALGVLTWPSSGGFEVQWESAMSSSALVVIAAHTSPETTPTIVCRASTLGSTAVSPTLIDMAGFRMIESVMRVTAYRDVTTIAESGHTYHVWAGVEGAVLLQALR